MGERELTTYDGDIDSWRSRETSRREISHRAPRTPIPDIVVSDHSDSSYSLDEEIVCAAAVEAFDKHRKPSVPCIRKHIQEVIQEEKSSPVNDISRTSRNIARLRSGDFPLDGSDSINYINNIVIKATQKALEEQQKNLQLKQSKIDSRLTKKQTAAICGLLSTIMSGVVAIIVKYV